MGKNGMDLSHIFADGENRYTVIYSWLSQSRLLKFKANRGVIWKAATVIEAEQA